MADFTPVALGVKPPQGMSLGDMLNVANAAQQYQQAQQINPLQVQRAQMEIEQAQKKNPLEIQRAQMEIEQAQKMNPLAVQKAETELGKSQFELNKSHLDVTGGALTGLESRAKIHAKTGDTKTALKELDSTEKYLNSYGIPSKQDGPLAQAREALKNNDMQGYLAQIENMRNMQASAADKFSANLPSYTTNAAGNLIGVTRATGELSPPIQKVPNINPTNADVNLGGEYAKTLQGRVQASNDWLQRSTEMRGILDEFKPGAGATTYAQIGQKLQAIGAPDDLVNKVANGDLAATQSLQKFMASSIMSAARQSAEGSPFASEVKNFESNNPSVNSDPKTLKRFIDFYDRLAGTSIKENEAMAQAKEKGIYNPGTWQADWQKMGQQQGLLPQTPSGKLPSESSQKQQEKTVVREGTLNGKRVIQYSDGSIRYK